MKKAFLVFLAVLLMTNLAHAQTKVSRIVVTTGIENKEPADNVSTVGGGMQDIYCFTEIQTDEYPTEITHIWIHEKNIEAEVKLFIGSPKWRTYSSKTISPDKTGEWKVEIYAQSGQLIDSVDFKVNEQ
ncbi:DUF2914 domain-containing protein [Geovibrio thiophilus]|uniref:DUF2914 domain-containing protein n=1 Tax=Geovibrio thiophilus TaxID=139438 RepID=A0A410JXX0_9BACT|nr:DUF2914 domain-containing protein [Geovibrio thiophilus]QAR33012.1 DUF2914 domain-containing protein [Geovibrio thiophilus]